MYFSFCNRSLIVNKKFVNVEPYVIDFFLTFEQINCQFFSGHRELNIVFNNSIFPYTVVTIYVSLQHSTTVQVQAPESFPSFKSK